MPCCYFALLKIELNPAARCVVNIQQTDTYIIRLYQTTSVLWLKRRVTFQVIAIFWRCVLPRSWLHLKRSADYTNYKPN